MVDMEHMREEVRWRTCHIVAACRMRQVPWLAGVRVITPVLPYPREAEAARCWSSRVPCCVSSILLVRRLAYQEL